MPSPAAPISPRFARPDAIVAAALFLVAATVFYGSIHHPLLAWDDLFHLTDNPFLQPGSPTRYLHFWRHPYGNMVVPITYNVWAFLYAHSFDSAGTPSPTLLHAANVGVHAICTALVYLLLLSWLARPPVDVMDDVTSGAFLRSPRFAALLGALLFALHPIQVEAVAWVSELRGLLATMFSLAALLAYSDESTAPRRRIGSAVLAAALLLLALLSKPSAAAAPAMMLVADVFLLRRAWRTIAWRLAAPAALAAACLLLMQTLQTTGQRENVALWERPFLAGDTLCFYFAKLAWPASLCTDYGHTPRVARASTIFWYAWLVPAALLVVAAWRRDRGALASLALFVAALLPVLGLVPFDFQRYSTTADRYVYLAMLGPALLVATLARLALSTEGTRATTFAVPFVAALLAVALGWRSIGQQSAWESNERLWTQVLRVDPRSSVAMMNLAGIAEAHHDRPGAERLMRSAIEAAPDRGNGYRGLAKLALNVGDNAAALDWYEKACAADPFDAKAFDGAGKLLATQGRLDEAEARFQKAVTIDPESVDGWCDLGALYLLRRRPGDALQALAHARTFNPRHLQTLTNIAFAHDLAGDLPAADRALADLDAVMGRSAVPRTLLADRAATRQAWPAVEHWLRAVVEVEPANADAWAGLGHALIQQKKRVEAIATYEKAVQINPRSERLRRELEAAKQQ